MKRDSLMDLSARWFTLLQRLYPADFRDEMGNAVVEAYMDRARVALKTGGQVRLAVLWIRALADSVSNGFGEWARPSIAWRRTGNWGRDAELVTRRLLRSPAFVAATVGTLTLGLGLFAVVYTAVDKILLEPMPYRNPDDLYFVWRDYGPIQDRNRGRLPGKDVVELQKAGGVIETAVALQPFLGGVLSFREGTDPIEISTMVTSPGLFEVLGVTPMLGRSFGSDDAGPGRQLVMVLTHELWTRFGADPEIIGKEVRLNGRPHTVIGVLPQDFRFVRNDSDGPAQRPDAYTTLRVNLADPSPNLSDYSALIRARPGTSIEVVVSAVDAVGRSIDARDFGGKGLRLYPVELKADLVARVRPALLVLGAAGGLFALMLMVNLSSVLLARAAQREHEFAVSRALGANDVAITRGTLLEGALLGFSGGSLGALAAAWGTRLLTALAPLDLPRRESIALGWDGAAVVVGVGIGLGLVAALAPALWASRASLSLLLASSAVRGGGGHGRMRRGMIVAQVALSLVLLSSGGLVVRSFEHLLRTDPGFKSEDVFTVLVRTPPVFFPERSDILAFQDRIHDALAALPGVTGAGAVNVLPLTSTSTTTFSQYTIEIPGAPGTTGDRAHDAVLTDVLAARAGYFEVMGIRLIAGRTFEKSRPAGVREAVIDTTLASRFFPQGNAVGATIPYGDSPLTVVGVVEQARFYDVHQDGRPQLYVRAEDFGYRAMFYTLRTPREPQTLLPEVRSAVRNIDSRVAVGEVRTMDEIVGNSLRQQRTSATLISAFAFGALLLAAMGLFGVISGSVTRRRHELAVRLAVGANHRRVLQLVLREAVMLVGVGLLIAVPGIYAAGRLIRGVLIGVSPFDPVTLLGVAVGLTLVSLVTCYVPARRVLKIDPAQLLRED
jgi:putative ABC transport system permease protein